VLCGVVWPLCFAKSGYFWYAEQVQCELQTSSTETLHAAHAVDLLVNFDIQPRATPLSKAAVLIRMHLS